jgi:hypothetical protein
MYDILEEAAVKRLTLFAFLLALVALGAGAAGAAAATSVGTSFPPGFAVPVDALRPTVVFDARFDETLSQNLQSGLLANFTDCGGLGCFTVGDKPTG